MPKLFPLIASLLLLGPVQGQSQADLLDTIKELDIKNDYIRNQAEQKVRRLGARLVPVIRKELDGSDSAAMRRAAKAASMIGPAAEPLVDILTRQLASDDEDLRGHVIAALGQIGAPARSALREMDKIQAPLDPETERILLVARSRIMKDPSKLWSSYVRASRSSDARMRFAGLTLAFRSCEAQKDLVPLFLFMTLDPDPDVRRQARKLLVGLKERARDEIDAIARGDNPLKSSQAMMMLGRFPLTQAQLAFLVAELEKQPHNQAARAGLLAAKEAALPAVLARFSTLVAEDAAPDVLDRFLFYFQGAGGAAKGAGKEIGSLLHRAERDLRLHSLETLRDIGYEDRAVEGAILRQISPKDRKVAEMAIGALGSSRNPSPAMLGLLVDLVGRSKNSAIRRLAMQALGRLGDRVEPAFEKLAVVLEGPDVKGRLWASVAFGQMDSKALSFLMDRYSKTKDSKRQARILVAFGEMGSKARPALSLMQEALGSKDADLVVASLVNLARMGDAARVAIPRMLVILGDEKAKAELRIAAGTALSLLGVGDPRLLEPMVAASRASIPELAWASILALGELGLAEARPRLIEATKDADPQMRWRAAFALGRLGGNADKAAPALEALLVDADDAVRYQAERALRELKGK